MRDNWLDKIWYNDIVEKIVSKRCKNPENLRVLLVGNKNGDKHYKVEYFNKGVAHEIFIEEFGELYTLNPFDNEDYFKIARKKNAGREIYGETFEEAFIKHYYDAIFNYRDQLLDLANNEKSEQEKLRKTHQAQDIYLLLIDRVNQFAAKHKVKMTQEEDEELSC